MGRKPETRAWQIGVTVQEKALIGLVLRVP
jgi:hypothetical protein